MPVKAISRVLAWLFRYYDLPSNVVSAFALSTATFPHQRDTACEFSIT